MMGNANNKQARTATSKFCTLNSRKHSRNTGHKKQKGKDTISTKSKVKSGWYALLLEFPKF